VSHKSHPLTLSPARQGALPRLAHAAARRRPPSRGAARRGAVPRRQLLTGRTASRARSASSRLACLSRTCQRGQRRRVSAPGPGVRPKRAHKARARKVSFQRAAGRALRSSSRRSRYTSQRFRSVPAAPREPAQPPVSCAPLPRRPAQAALATTGAVRGRGNLQTKIGRGGSRGARARTLRPGEAEPLAEVIALALDPHRQDLRPGAHKASQPALLQ